MPNTKGIVMGSWYVLQTKAHRERDVQKLLRNGGFETFLPILREVSYRGGLPYFKLSSLFPGYLFLNCFLEEKNNFHLVKYTRGINKIISACGKPLKMDDDIIHSIQNRANAEGIINQQPDLLKAGDKVRVKKGILKDLIGILERPSTAEGRITVLLHLINYQMKATLHWSEVEKLQVA